VIVHGTVAKAGATNTMKIEYVWMLREHMCLVGK
jgi:hypothetical protein